MKQLLKFAAVAALFTTVAVSDTTSFTIHVIGDSTVCTYKDSAYPQTGWGQVLSPFFDQSRVKVINYAIGGRSSKSFVEEGRLASVLDATQAGDYIFVQMGTNDRDYSKAARYVPIDSSAYWFQQYVDGAKGKGAHIILMSPLMLNTYPRNVFDNNLTDATHKGKEYPVKDTIAAVAKRNGVPFVDLTTKTYNLYTQLSSAYISRYIYKMFLAGEYPNYADGVTNDGTTHFQESGSVVHAQLITEGLKENLNSSTVNATEKAALTTLVAAISPTYKLTVKSNVSNSSGLITHNQNLPGGAALALHVSPGSFGKTFQNWVDDDCNVVSTDSNYYHITMPYRDITYTAMFAGGTACTKTAHAEESSSSVIASSSSVEISSSSVFNDSICFTGTADAAWPSPIDMSNPEESEGTTDTNHEGYTGMGFYNIANNATSKAVYNLTSNQSASNARVMIRYSFAGTENRDMKFTIDYGTYDVSFPPTADWDTWDTTYIDSVWVDAVDFKLTIQSTVASGGPNIDMIAFDIKGVSRTGCEPAKVPEAESSSSSVDVESSSSTSDEVYIGRKGIRSLRLMDSNGQVNLLGRKVHSNNQARGVYFKMK